MMVATDFLVIPSLKLYFTPDEAAACLGLSMTTIESAIQGQELRVYDYRDNIPRVSRYALEQWRKKQVDSVRRTAH
jgi:excisionase family DNA binding protein